VLIFFNDVLTGGDLRKIREASLDNCFWLCTKNEATPE
jgi:hypothetical protein